nr:ATP-binding protein [uncultured Rhodopila sp.]
MVSVGPESLIVQAEITELGRVAAWAESLNETLQLPPSTAFAVQLCFEEAVSNVMRHGFVGAPGAGKDILLALERRGDTVIAAICDRGVAFDPLAMAPPAPAASIEDAVVGGQGIHLMRTFAQRMDYERRDGMNRLTLRFIVPGPLPDKAPLR